MSATIQAIPTALAPPPPGQTANFTHPEDRRPEGIALCAVIFSLMILASAARTYSKAVITKRFGPDDWVCLLATAVTIGYTAIAFDSLRQPGIGIHDWDILIAEITPATNRELIASSTIYPVGLFTVKLSIFLLLYRIFSVQKRPRYLIFFGIGTSALFYFITMVLVLVWCAPAPGESVDHAVSAETCSKKVLTLSAAQAGFNALSDFYLLFIALPAIYDLNTSTKRKLKAGSVFTLGLIASVLSVLNLYYRIKTYHSHDPTWDDFNILICSVYEMNIGLICACMPCFPSLMNTSFAQGILSIGSWSFLSSLRSRTNLDASSRGGGSRVNETQSGPASRDDSSQKGFANSDEFPPENSIKQTNTFQLTEFRRSEGSESHV